MELRAVYGDNIWPSLDAIAATPTMPEEAVNLESMQKLGVKWPGSRLQVGRELYQSYHGIMAKHKKVRHDSSVHG